jgi:hypothetical protein
LSGLVVIAPSFHFFVNERTGTDFGQSVAKEKQVCHCACTSYIERL